MKVSKTKANGKYLYIQIMDFRDEQEWDLMYTRIQQLLKDSKGRTKVF